MGQSLCKSSKSSKSSDSKLNESSSSTSGDKVRTLKHKWTIRDFANAHLITTEEGFIDSDIFGDEDAKFFLRIHLKADNTKQTSSTTNCNVNFTDIVNINKLIVNGKDGKVIYDTIKDGDSGKPKCCSDPVSLYVHCVHLSDKLQTSGIKMRAVCKANPLIQDTPHEESGTLKVGQSIGWDHFVSRTKLTSFMYKNSMEDFDMCFKIHYVA